MNETFHKRPNGPGRNPIAPRGWTVLFILKLFLVYQKLVIKLLKHGYFNSELYSKVLGIELGITNSTDVTEFCIGA